MPDNSQSLECPVKGISDNESSKCPVKHSKAPSSSGFWGWFPYWKTPSASENIKFSESYNPKTNDYIFDGNKSDASQKKDLRKIRAVSSIPKGDIVPAHQPENVERWVYPSEQQYFNAMRKKGYNPQEEDVPVILAIHNMVNEEAWSRIKEWESLHDCNNIKLARFTGRPKDLSPKAFLRSLIGYSLPFDRHDWHIDRNGQEVRYVIDFYKGTKSKSTNEKDGIAPITMHMDVRPALDSFTALYDRVYVSMRDTLFGKPRLGYKQLASTNTSHKTSTGQTSSTASDLSVGSVATNSSPVTQTK
mmetsp:Transcript_41063/g.41946  ORF Transcript_41063/g.41946 Transcript_41063/m.41946 type:complete len:303 (+) Transcript_41063:157-1065(+)